MQRENNPKVETEKSSSKEAERFDVVELIAEKDFPEIVKAITAFIHAGQDPCLDSDIPRVWHFGLYGVVLSDRQILVVHKSRGVYTGWLDLPGGSPEFGESLDEALSRELKEETGGDIVSVGPWEQFDLLITEDSSGNPVSFRHFGLFRRTQLENIEFSIKPFEDSSGISWLEIDNAANRTDLSEPLRYIISQIQDI